MKSTPLTLIAIVLLSGLVLFSGCDGIVYGNGKLMKKNFEARNFNSLDVSGAFKIYLSQGVTESLRIETDENIMDYVSAEVQGNTLHIGTHGIMNLSNATLKAYVTVRKLEEVKVSGAVELLGKTMLDGSHLNLETTGAGKLDLELYCERLNIEISGAGKINLNGKSNDMSVEVSGAGNLNAGEFKTGRLDIIVSGAGNATVNVENEIDAKISGAGKVSYLGNPNVRSQVSGAGSLNKIN